MKAHLINMILYIKSKIASFVLAAFLPIVEAIFFCGILIFADMVTGVWKVVKKHGWSHVKSKVAWNGVMPKLVIYPSIIILGSMANHFFQDIPFVRGGVFLIFAIEMKSLYENASEILGVDLLKYIKILITMGRKEVIEEIIKEEK